MYRYVYVYVDVDLDVDVWLCFCVHVYVYAKALRKAMQRDLWDFPLTAWLPKKEKREIPSCLSSGALLLLPSPPPPLPALPPGMTALW